MLTKARALREMVIFRYDDDKYFMFFLVVSVTFVVCTFFHTK